MQQQLQQGTLLQGGKYRIERVLGQGGFGITYLAEQVSLGRKVAIKEFFMKDLSERSDDTRTVETPSTGSSKQVELYRRKFIKEAKNLAKLNHPNIISVIEVFEENNTVYYVMPYLSGGSLFNRVMNNGTLSEDEAMRYIRQIAKALKYMHEEMHICHYDVKPSNVLLDGKGNAVLIDFGISKNYDASGHETSTTPIGLSEGYAPIEQYRQNVSDFSPVSDVYALGATLYFLLHGKRPVDAPSRAGGTTLLMKRDLLPNTKDLINASLKISKTERAQNMDVFLNYQNDSDGPKDEGAYFENVGTETATPYAQPLKQGMGKRIFSKLALNTIPQSLFKTRTIDILMVLIACLSFLTIYIDRKYDPINTVEPLPVLEAFLGVPTLWIFLMGMLVLVFLDYILYLPLLSGMKKIDKTVFSLLLLFWLFGIVSIVSALASGMEMIGDRYSDYISNMTDFLSIITGMMIIYKYDGRIQIFAKILVVNGFLYLLLNQYDDSPLSLGIIFMLVECMGIWFILTSKEQNQINCYSSGDESLFEPLAPWSLWEANGETKRWLWLIVSPLLGLMMVLSVASGPSTINLDPKSRKALVIFGLLVICGLAWLINIWVKWKLKRYERSKK